MIDKHVFHAEVQGDQRGPDGAGLLQLHGCHGPPHRTASRSEANPRLTSVFGSGFRGFLIRMRNPEPGSYNKI